MNPTLASECRKKTRLLLADDHEIVRKGLRNLLDGHSRWSICGEAENGQEAVRKALDLRPELVLLDISMPIMNGLDAAREIRRLAPSTKIVIFSMHDSPRIADEARRAGADTYLTKTTPFEKLENTLAGLFEVTGPIPMAKTKTQ
jgi:DNA-binding NarL/FixJ family response regulator